MEHCRTQPELQRGEKEKPARLCRVQPVPRLSPPKLSSPKLSPSSQPEESEWTKHHRAVLKLMRNEDLIVDDTFQNEPGAFVSPTVVDAAAKVRESLRSLLKRHFPIVDPSNGVKKTEQHVPAQRPIDALRPVRRRRGKQAKVTLSGRPLQPHRHTLLMMAARRGSISSFIMLLENCGASPHVTCYKGGSTVAGMLAARAGRIEWLEHLFGAPHANVTTCRDMELLVSHSNSGGWTVLAEAVRSKNVATCSWLISNGADVNATMGARGWSLLHQACRAGSADIVRLLIDNGADWNVQARHSQFPPQEGITIGRTIRRLLHAWGVSRAKVTQLKTFRPCSRRRMGMSFHMGGWYESDHVTPFDVALSGGHAPIVETLLRQTWGERPARWQEDAVTTVIVSSASGP